jgi:hypothetical protein
MREEEDWTDWDAGPVSRPYMVTGGRTRQRTTLRFDLVDFVGRTLREVGDGAFTPERSAILDMCEEPIAVADLASALSLPLGVVRIVLDDLVHDGLIELRVTAPRDRVTDPRLLERILAGIRAL